MGVGAPPPTCTRKACVQLASVGISNHIQIGTVKNKFLQLLFISLGHRSAGSAAIDKIIVARNERRLVGRNK